MSVQYLTTMQTVPTRNRDLWKSAFDNEIIFVSKKIFLRILIVKMSEEMNFKIITKNHAADPEKGFLTKSVLKPYGITRPRRQRES